MMSTQKAFVLILSSLALGITGAVFVHSAASGVPPVTDDAAVSQPAADIALFKHAGRSSTSAVLQVASIEAPMLEGANASVPEQAKPGAKIAGTVRTAVVDGSLTVWAYKTTKGRVCKGLLLEGELQASGCTNGWSDRLPVGVGTIGLDNGHTVTFGLAPNNVVAVDVVVDGVTHHAVMGENAYIYDSAAGGTVQSVVATRGDGRAIRVDLPHAANPIG